jgi:hypothetical protein
MEQDLNAAEGLVGWYRSMGWIGENEGAEGVMKKAPLCKGCWNTTEDCFFRCGSSGECNLRDCCTKKQINHCGDCIDFPCVKYMEFVGDLDHHKKAMEYLMSKKTSKDASLPA